MRVAVAICMVLGAGCKVFYGAPEPMKQQAWPLAASTPAKCLIVLLPGFGDSTSDFEDNGFVAELKKRPLSVDIVAAQATFGYYLRGTVASRLETDVIAPAQPGRYEQLWLIGTSMGGMGSLLYAREHPWQVTGVLALAPYLGDKEIANTVRSQGGLERWKSPPKADVLDEDHYAAEIWRWQQAVRRGKEAGPALYMGYGRDDKLESVDTVLAASLSSDHVFLVDGIHDWGPWKHALQLFLDSPALAGCRR